MALEQIRRLRAAEYRASIRDGALRAPDPRFGEAHGLGLRAPDPRFSETSACAPDPRFSQASVSTGTQPSIREITVDRRKQPDRRKHTQGALPC